jgi:hypothetical protein
MRSSVPWIVTLFLAGLVSLQSSAQSTATPAETPSADIQAQDSSSAQDSTPKAASPPASATSDRNGNQAKQNENSDSEVPPEKRKFRLRFGGVAIGAGYSHFSGPLYYPYSYPYAPLGMYPGDWYSASLWYPLWSPYPYYGPGAFTYNNGRGEVRLTSDPKVAAVYIDGGYAGTADKLKSLWLDPGAYDLTVSAAGRESFHQRVYVLSGKSVKITAKLKADESRNDGKEKP